MHVQLAANTVEKYVLYRHYRGFGGEMLDQELETYPTKAAAIKAGRKLEKSEGAQWIVLVTACVAESSGVAAERADRIAGAAA
jgi:hypothetical protein